MHEVNIETIQNETLKIIKTSQELLTEIDSQNSAGGEEKTTGQSSIKNYTAMFRNEEKKLKTLDFVIAVVGTMKAGKSTTINAIVGQEVLPNRAFPMTALPTLVTHQLGKKEPELTLPKIKPLNALLESLKGQLRDHNGDGDFLGTKDGKTLITLILSKKIEFKSHYHGQDEIFSFLKILNDLMRAAKDLDVEPPYGEFRDIDELPRIEVEFYHLKHLENISEAKLSILDTPGPNEFEHSKHLQKIFTTQLHQASAIMLIMDYTVMNSQSDGDVRGQVKAITDLIGQERISVLLNKYDEKGKNDSNYDETREHVAKHLLDNQVPIDNIYPVSSKIAFLVNRGLSELEEKGEINPSLPWVEDFGEEIIGRRWKKTIGDIEEVKELCKEAWDEDSYFEKPLNNIIIHAHAKAAVGSISATLTKLLEISKNLDNAFKTRENALTKGIEELKGNIDKLQEDISNMGEISESIQHDIEMSLGDVQAKLNQLTEQQLGLAEEGILDIFENQEKLISAQKEAEREEQENKPRLNIMNILFGSQSKKYESKHEELLKEGQIHFDSIGEAKDFTFQIQELLEKNINTVLDDSEAKFQEEVKGFIPAINEIINAKLGDLLETMQERMGASLDIELPEVVFTKDGISIKGVLTDTIKSETNSHTNWVQSDSIVGATKRVFGVLFGQDDWGYEKETNDVTTFIITKDDIQKNIQDVFQSVSDIIKNNAENIYANEIQSVVSLSMKDLVREIEGYRGEMLAVVKKREDDSCDIEQEIASVKINQDLTQRIMKRIGVTAKVLKEQEAKND